MNPQTMAATVILLVVGTAAVVSIVVATRRQTRMMDELWEAARQADREWYAAMYRYLSAPVKPTPAARQAPDDAVTVELEVIKPERNEKDG